MAGETDILQALTQMMSLAGNRGGFNQMAGVSNVATPSPQTPSWWSTYGGTTIGAGADLLQAFLEYDMMRKNYNLSKRAFRFDRDYRINEQNNAVTAYNNQAANKARLSEKFNRRSGGEAYNPTYLTMGNYGG